MPPVVGSTRGSVLIWGFYRNWRIIGRMRLEIHPRNGGADAEMFAGELAGAIGKHARVQPSREGRVVVLERL